MKKVYKGKLITEDQIIEQGVLVTEGERVLYAGEKNGYPLQGNEEIIDYSAYWLSPGFIDIHVHGGVGFDVMDGTEEALISISRGLASFGVTGFLPTTMTAPLPEIQHVLELIKETKNKPVSGAQILGVHLEGPWISHEYKGAQNEKFITHPTPEQVAEIMNWLGDLATVVTIAPEIPGALEAIRTLSEHGIICSIGHTNATHEQVTRAAREGASHFTHAFNAMRGLHHREPGVVGALMGLRHMTCDVIADLVHSHACTLDILYQLKGRDKLLLISDGMQAVGLPDGEYSLGGQAVYVRQCIARLADQTLAGSTLSLNRAVQNMVEVIGLSLQDAVYMAATAPAKKLGMDQHKGSLVAGKDADITVLTSDFQVVETVVKGKTVYKGAH